MSTIRLVVRLTKIQDMAKLKALLAEALQIVKEKDPGTVQYEFYIDEEAATCVGLESYTSSEAMEAHVQNVGAVLGQLGELCELAIEALGNADDKGAALLGAFGVKAMPFHDGIRLGE